MSPPSPGTCTTDYVGQEFYAMFLEMNSSGRDLELYIGNPGTEAVNVTVETPGLSSTSAITQSVDASKSEKITLPSSLMLDGSAIGDTGIYISATGDITVFGLNSQTAGCGGFKVLPKDALGYNHYAIAHWPDELVRRRGVIGIVATEDSTEIKVILDPSRGTSFTYNGNKYSGTNAEVTVYLNRYQVFQVQADSDSDLSGTKISADRVIAVFSGMTLTRIGSPDSEDHLVAQSPPIHAYGYNYALMPFPEVDRYRVQVVASADDTYISVRDVPLAKAGDIAFADLSTVSGPLFIKSNKPILVGQYAESQSTPNKGGPSLVLVPSYEQYKNSYTFSVPYGASAYPTYLLMLIDSGRQNEIRLNGISILVNWKAIPESTPPMVAGYYSVTSGLYKVNTVGNLTPFGAYLWGYEPNTQCGFAYLAGQCLKDIGPVSILLFSVDLIIGTLSHSSTWFHRPPPLVQALPQAQLLPPQLQVRQLYSLGLQRLGLLTVSTGSKPLPQYADVILSFQVAPS